MSVNKFEYSDIIDNIEKELDKKDVFSLFFDFYDRVYKMIGWKYVGVGNFREGDGCYIWIDGEGREDEIVKIVIVVFKMFCVDVISFFKNVKMRDSRIEIVK